MAGRNWTRKSIEELVKAYLNKHGGGSKTTLWPSVSRETNTGLSNSNIDLYTVSSPHIQNPLKIPNKWLGDKTYYEDQPNADDAFIIMKNGTIKIFASEFNQGYFATTLTATYANLPYIYFFQGSTVTRINVTSTTSNTLTLNTSYEYAYATSASVFPKLHFVFEQIYSARIDGNTDVIDFLILSEYADEVGTWLFSSQELTEDDVTNDTYTTYEEVTL